MNPVKCIVVDDEYGAVEILKGFIDRVPWLECSNTFNDPLEALNYLNTNPVDLVFLDISMPDLNGLQLSRMIDPQVQIIFCTAYPEHAVESYEIEALDYLLKPVALDRFLKAVAKVQRTPVPGDPEPSSSSSDRIFIKSGTQIHQVDTRDVSVISKDGHYVILRVKGKELLSRMTFAELSELLPADRFIQIHRSYMISLEKIEVIQKQFVTIDGRELPIGEAFKQQFFEKVKYFGN